jgi:hypothetical protein
MQRTKINSSNINSAGYDHSNHILEIEFSSGDVYQYLNVPENIFNLFVSASSHGSFFAHQIKDNFSFRKV